MKITQQQMDQAIRELHTDMEMSYITIAIMINGYDEGKPVVDTRIVKTRKGASQASIEEVYPELSECHTSIILDVYRDSDGIVQSKSRVINAPFQQGL